MNSTTRRLLSAVAALSLITTVASVPVQAAGQQSLAGADLVSLRLDGEQVRLLTRDAEQARRNDPGHDPAAVAVDAGPGTAGTVPSGADFAFLGPVGSPVWAMVSAGSEPVIDTTAIPPGEAKGIQLSLVDVTGPGDFFAYAVSPVGVPTVQLTSTGGPTAVGLPPGIRRGTIWAFNQPGEYTVTLAAQVNLVSGRQATGQGVYRISVPAPPFTDPNLRPLDSVMRLTEPAPLVAAQAPPVQVAATATTPGNRKVFAAGHVDMGPQLTGSGWTIRIKDDSTSPPTWRELSDVVLHVVDKSKIEVPPGADYTFLGAPGATVWLLPQAQQADILWPGWNTQDTSVVNGTTGDVTWKLGAVSGPGAFKLFLTGSFGKPQILFDSAKALPQNTAIPPNTHAHGNWAFTAPGIYRLSVTMTGTRTGGGTLADTRTLTIAVGAVDPNTGFTGGGGNPTGTGNLPRTGSSWIMPAITIAAVLLLAGTILVILARRRRTTQNTDSMTAAS